MAMNSWEWIFRQSRVNDGDYDEDRLPLQNWHWPRDTWFQDRLRYLRSTSGKHSKELSERVSHQIH
jgi:hypothetical protein